MATNRIQAKSRIEKLVAYFEKNIHQLKAPSFNETQTRNQLIDPLFEALGWDVHNTSMKPLYLQEVVPEGRVKTTFGKESKEQTVLFRAKETLGKEYKEYSSILDYIAEDEYKANSKEATKKPDYRFRIKGQTKFFLEAKKPSVDLIKSQDAIFQVKRYGFSGRVPVAILTNFEEFRVFDCTQKPLYEKPKLGIIKDFDFVCANYLDRFDQLFDTFSRDAVEAGSLDALTTKLLQKRTGDFALDKTFLEDLSRWRIELARDIAKHPRNRRKLNDYTLNESVQRILDRIVFFRVCEDREIEVENTLLAILRMWKDRPGVSLYSLLNQLFQQRRSLYNGLLFSPHECEELEVGDKVLLEILENLNYPFSPYHFNEIGVEILGSIYEKFLGKTIHLTAKTVRVDEKPEVRKAGGVYYTPQYIVNYIVDNTVGELLYGERNPLQRRGDDEVVGVGQKDVLSQLPLLLSPRQVAKLKIIDIACGSGSFLLGAFQKLIEYHIEWYRTHPKDIQTVNGVPDAYTDANGNLHISSRKKRDILVNNIYGVDIDRQAVEVTQMSLYLKVLEGENAETLNPQMTLALKEVYLPVLTDNIKCGNSLIGTDFAAQGDFFDVDKARKINAFDWETEFLAIFQKRSFPNASIGNPEQSVDSRQKRAGMTEGAGGGFDCVIGNPPYVRMEELKEIKEYLKQNFDSHNERSDLYSYFIEKGHKLLRRNGRFGMIISNKFLRANYGKPLRRFIAGFAAIEKVVDFAGLPVFQGATVRTIVLITSLRTKNGQPIRYSPPVSSERFEILAKGSIDVENAIADMTYDISQSGLGENGWSFGERSCQELMERLRKDFISLSSYCSGRIFMGVKSGLTEAFVIDSQTRTKILKQDKTCGEIIKPFLNGRDVRKYSIESKELFLVYTFHGINIKKYPAVEQHLKPFKPQLQKRATDQSWYELQQPQERFSKYMEEAKIIFPDIATEPRFALDDFGFYGSNTTYFIPLRDLYLLGLLNSKVGNSYFVQTCAGLEGKHENYLRFFGQYLEGFPVRTIDFTKPEEKKMHDDLVALVDKMLELHKQLEPANLAKVPNLRKVLFESEKEPIERQIVATDKKIDTLVYQLYGLTEEEIGIVESQNR